MKKCKISLFLLTLLLMVLGSTCTTQAASYKWNKACKAYQTFLKKNVSKFVAPTVPGTQIVNPENYKKTARFAVLDMDKNGIPELISWHLWGYHEDKLFVYTYKNGKVTRVKNSEVDLFCQVRGWYNAVFCKKGHLHAKLDVGIWGKYEYVYALKNGALKLYAQSDQDFIRDTEAYYVNGKRVSSSRYRSAVKNCKITSEIFYENTKTNRKKYVK